MFFGNALVPKIRSGRIEMYFNSAKESILCELTSLFYLFQ